MIRSFWLVGVAMLLAACHGLGTGTSGPNVQTGSALADGSIPYSVGRSRPFQVAGLPDEAIADSRADASLETSGAGSAELARRTATADLQGPPRPSRWPGEIPATDADRILLERIDLALSSTSSELAAIHRSFSIQTLNNLQIGTHKGVVMLRGRASSFEDKKAIEARIRSVKGVSAVVNELEVAPPPSPTPGGVPTR